MYLAMNGLMKNYDDPAMHQIKIFAKFYVAL